MGRVSRKSRPWRLGLDLGTNSVGWCVLDLKRGPNGHQHPIAIRRMGSRIYTDGRDPQSGASLAQERRGPRGSRRRRDRYLDRRTDLLKLLIDADLMPRNAATRKALEAADPWLLRSDGLDRALSTHELGRAIFHLNQRRGFKSNRKTDRGKDDKSAKEADDMKTAARKIAELIGPDKPNSRTLGEHLYKTRRATLRDGVWQALTHAAAETVRARPEVVKGRNEYDFYPTRELILAEFDALWAAQARHHPDLTDTARDAIRDVIFFQRPLRPVEPGPCTLDDEPDLDKRDRRAPLALPTVQEFRILQELANLELVHRKNPTRRQRLTLAQRDRLLHELRRAEKVSFKKIRRLLSVDDIWTFNLESERRPDLRGDASSVRLSRKDGFGERWWTAFDDVARDSIVRLLLNEETEARLIAVATDEWGLSPEAAVYVANTRLPDSFGSLGTKALSRIVPILRTEVDSIGHPIRYSDAVQRAGYLHHSDFRDGELLEALPYYGETLRRYTAPVRSESAPEWEREFGRLANPTVHIGLGQLRKVVNALIEAYGVPEEIVVELARDLKRSLEEREDVQRQQYENQKKNELRQAKIDECIAAERMRGNPGWRPPRDALLRMRLWEELNQTDASDRKCVYSGQPISMRMLLDDSAVEIEHILPFAQSLDDSPSNLTVSLRTANREKAKRTPHEAFGRRAEWDSVMLRVSALPKAKQWRFREDAADLVRDRVRRDAARQEGNLPKEALEDIESSSGFLARQLIDTAYLARVTRQYLWKICDPDKTWVIPGQMTALLRRKWGLNSLLSGNDRKSRDDHRHHAVDAFVVGLTDRSMLQALQRASAQSDDRIVDDMPEPWEGFREDLDAALRRIVVSHRPDHGIDPKKAIRDPHVSSGRLHEETAYGLVKDPDREGGNVVARKPLMALSENEVDRIRDPALRAKLKAFLGDDTGDGGALDAAKARLKDARNSKDAHAIERATAETARLKRERQQLRKAGAKDFKAALEKFGDENGIRRVRLVKPEAALVVIRDVAGRPYKAYSAGDNHHVDIYARPDGRWGREIVTAFDANQPDFTPGWRREDADARLIATVHKNDLVRLTVDGELRTMRVVSLWDRYLQLAGHNEANLAERYRAGMFKWTFANYDKLKEIGWRRVTVDLLGRVNDPGPPK